MKRLVIARSGELNPYYNLGFEEYLFDNLNEGDYVLYLWRNEDTVVIGLNQNAISECNICKLLEKGGYLARRKTGGGAVYHDKNNLNFTFIGRKEYNVPAQLDIILNAIKSLNIDAVKSGRNDLTLTDGRKFSGNAFLEKGCKALHHGTILIDTDSERLKETLTVSNIKLDSKGVKSVTGRIVNLKSVNPDIDTDSVQQALIDSAIDVFKPREVKYISDRSAPVEELNKYKDYYSNDKFIYGDRLNYSLALEKKFTWGTARVEYSVKKGYISGIKLYTDSLDTTVSKVVERELNGISLDCAKALSDKASDVYQLIKYGG
ncbi:MAG: lipoate--protein ligase [Christensenellales bacterium]|jgi:lipoate-protein ligase A